MDKSRNTWGGREDGNLGRIYSPSVHDTRNETVSAFRSEGEISFSPHTLVSTGFPGINGRPEKGLRLVSLANFHSSFSKQYVNSPSECLAAISRGGRFVHSGEGRIGGNAGFRLRGRRTTVVDGARPRNRSDRRGFREFRVRCMDGASNELSFYASKVG